MPDEPSEREYLEGLLPYDRDVREWPDAVSDDEDMVFVDDGLGEAAEEALEAYDAGMYGGDR